MRFRTVARYDVCVAERIAHAAGSWFESIVADSSR